MPLRWFDAALMMPKWWVNQPAGQQLYSSCTTLSLQSYNALTTDAQQLRNSPTALMRQTRNSNTTQLQHNDLATAIQRPRDSHTTLVQQSYNRLSTDPQRLYDVPTTVVQRSYNSPTTVVRQLCDSSFWLVLPPGGGEARVHFILRPKSCSTERHGRGNFKQRLETIWWCRWVVRVFPECAMS